MSVRRLAALAVLLATVTGCGGSEAGIARGGRVVGDAVTVYSSLPDPGRGASRDMVQGQKLALLEADGRAAGLGVNFVSVDEGGIGADDSPAVAAAVAEQVIRDPQVMAVIGALRSRSAMTSVPLYNAAGILHVSPGAGYPGFSDPVAPGEPERWFPSGRRTFARLAGDDREQARALLAATGGGRVAIEEEAGRVPAALADALRRAASGAGDVTLVADPRRADAVVYAGEDLESAAGVADALAREAPDAAVVLPDALTRAGIAERLSPAARRRAVLVSSAPEPGSTPELRAFEAAFRERFGRAPGPYAAVGYDAMRRVLGAIERAGAAAGRRSRVIDAFFVVPPQPPRFTARPLAPPPRGGDGRAGAPARTPRGGE